MASTSDLFGKALASAGRSLTSLAKDAIGIKDLKPENVIAVLDEIVITNTDLSSEAKLEKRIYNVLHDTFQNAETQYNIGGYLGLRVDIDLGDGKVGIELKLADELVGKAQNIERLIGQTAYYTKRIYKKNNLIVLIAGESSISTKPMFKELKEIVESYDAIYYYLKVTDKKKK